MLVTSRKWARAPALSLACPTSQLMFSSRLHHPTGLFTTLLLTSPPPIFITKHDLLFYSPFKIFIYLAIMNLSCGMQALRSSLRLMACLVVAFELLVAERGI